jgi:hypothetical protein
MSSFDRPIAGAAAGRLAVDDSIERVETFEL